MRFKSVLNKETDTKKSEMTDSMVEFQEKNSQKINDEYLELFMNANFPAD